MARPTGAARRTVLAGGHRRPSRRRGVLCPAGGQQGARSWLPPEEARVLATARGWSRPSSRRCVRPERQVGGDPGQGAPYSMPPVAPPRRAGREGTRRYTRPRHDSRPPASLQAEAPSHRSCTPPPIAAGSPVLAFVPPSRTPAVAVAAAARRPLPLDARPRCPSRRSCWLRQVRDGGASPRPRPSFLVAVPVHQQTPLPDRAEAVSPTQARLHCPTTRGPRRPCEHAACRRRPPLPKPPPPPTSTDAP